MTIETEGETGAAASRPYLLKTHARSALVVEQPQVFVLPDRTVTVTDWKERSDGTHLGPFFEVRGTAANLEQAREVGVATASLVAHLMAVAMAVGIGTLDPPAIVYMVGASRGTELVQFAEVSGSVAATRKLDPAAMQAVWDQFTKLTERQ